jgi:hypothetical protein
MAIARSLAVLALVALWSASAAAQTAEAETLFREGKRLLKQGDTAAACDKFEASERLEASVGTELNLADCREKLGQLASAWATFMKAAASAKRSDNDGKREAEARRRASELEGRLVHLRIVVTDGHPDAMTVTRNGAAVDPALWNQRVPVDPGDYEIAAEAPGYAAWKTTVAIKDKDKKVEVPALDKAAGGTVTAGPVGAKPAHATEGGEVVTPLPPPATGMTPRRKAGLVVAGVGVAALAGAVALVAIASSSESSANAICPGTFCTSAHAIALNTEARNDALYGDIGFAVAGALVATGAVLWALGGRRAAVEVSVGASSRGGSLAIGGAW